MKPIVETALSLLRKQGSCFILLQLISFFSLTLYANPPLNWSQTQIQLFQNNSDLQIATIDSLRAEAQWRESRGSFLPSLDLTGNYSALTQQNRLQFELPLPTGQLQSITKNLGSHDKWEVGLDLTYPLFTGLSRGYQVSAKKENLTVQGLRLQALREALSLKLAVLFCAWNIADAGQAFHSAQVALAKGQLHLAESQLKQEMGANRQVLSARSKLLIAQMDQISAQNQADSLRVELAAFIGLDPEGFYPLRDTVADGLPDTLDVGHINQRIQNRPEIVSLSHQTTALSANEKALFSQRLPYLGAVAGWRVANPGLNLAGTEAMNYGLIGLQLKWNLFDGLRNQSQRLEIRERQKQLTVEAIRIERDLKKAESLAALQYRRWKAQAEAAKAGREASDRGLADAYMQLQQGIISAIDTLEPASQLARARMLERQAVAGIKLTYCQWKYAKGETLRFE